MQFGDWVPEIFSMDEDDLPDRYEFYANPEKTVWVSLNQRRKRFRICFCEMVNICSDWLNEGISYELQPIEGKPRSR
jgi:hypothetical protein